MYDHFIYCEALARSLQAIKHTDKECHFLKSDETEEIIDLAERSSSISGMVLVAIDGLNSDYSYNNGGGFQEIPQYFIIVMKHIPSGDIVSFHTAKRECKAVGTEIIKKLLMDYHEGENGLEFLEPSTITCRGVGPIGDNFHGVLIGFNLIEPDGFMLNREMWQ